MPEYEVHYLVKKWLYIEADTPEQALSAAERHHPRNWNEANAGEYVVAERTPCD